MKTEKPRWKHLTFEALKARYTLIRDENAKHNESVKTRQVRRHQLFWLAVAHINKGFGGELRVYRRKMASRLAKKWFREQQA